MAGRGPKRWTLEALHKSSPILGDENFNLNLGDMEAILGRSVRQKITGNIQQRMNYFIERYKKTAETAEVFKSSTPQPEHPEAVEIKKILETLVLLANACKVPGVEDWASKRLGEYEQWTRNGGWNNLGDVVMNDQLYDQWPKLNDGEKALQVESGIERNEEWFVPED